MTHQGPTPRDCPECERLHDADAARAGAGLDVPESTGENQRGDPLERSALSRALDATDDVMISRGHRLSSYSNEEYAVVLRAALAASHPVAEEGR